MKIASIVNEVSVEFHDKLNPAFWENMEIKTTVQVKLLTIAKKFIEFLKVPNLNLKDIWFMGSNAAYVYTNFSDIDLHIIVDDPDDHLKELYDAKKRLWNEQHNITIKGYDVELYVQDIKEPNASMGIYSLLKNKWLTKPQKVKANIDDVSVQQKFKHIAKMINHGIKKHDKDYLDKVATEIKDMRKAGLQRAGEFSAENLAFKELRNGGYLEKLSNARQELEDAELSLDETLKNDYEITNDQLKLVLLYADKLFKAAGLDIVITRHFVDRLRDPRNYKPITKRELLDIFNKAYKQLDRGREIARLGPEAQAVLKDMENDINIPFILKWDSKNEELDLVMKTIMRKRNFMSSNPTFTVENKYRT